MLLFRIRPRLRPRAVRNGVPNFGRQALVKHKLARANLLSARMKRSTTSAVGTSTRLLLLDFASQERLRVSGAHSPRARWAGRRSSHLFARHLIFSRTLACRHQHPAVPSFDLGSCPRFESPTTINSSNLVLLVITVFCSVLLRLLVWFALVWRVSIVHLLSSRTRLPSCQWRLGAPGFLVPTPLLFHLVLLLVGFPLSCTTFSRGVLWGFSCPVTVFTLYHYLATLEMDELI